MTPAEQAAREQLIQVILCGLNAYAPDEIETYAHEEAAMIADYVRPYVAQALAQARQEEREACAMIADAPEWDWHSSGHGDEQWPCLSAQTIAAAIRSRSQEQP